MILLPLGGSGMTKLGNLLAKSINTGLTVFLEKLSSAMFRIPVKLSSIALQKNCFFKRERNSSELSDVMSRDTDEVGRRRTFENTGMIIIDRRERRTPRDNILLLHLPDERRTPPPPESSSPPKFMQSRIATTKEIQIKEANIVFKTQAAR